MAKKKNEEGTLLVEVAGATTRRGRGIRSIPVEELTENVTQFVSQIGKVLQETPDAIGKFRLSEFTVSAEVSAKGALVLLGSGVEATGKSALTFKFTRQ